MTIETLGFDLTVCKVASFARINTSAEFFFTGKTDKEISLVCRTQDVPPEAEESIKTITRSAAKTAGRFFLPPRRAGSAHID